MNKEQKRLLIELLQDYYDGGDSSVFDFYIPWTPDREAEIARIQMDDECHFDTAINREKPHMNPEWIVIQGIDTVVRYFIKVLKEEIKDETNRKDGTGIVRVDMPVGDPNRISTDRL